MTQVVFAEGAQGGSGLSMFSPKQTVAAGPVPPGMWYLAAAATLTVLDPAATPPATTSTQTIAANSLVISDGTNVTVAASTTGVKIGGFPPQ